MIPILVRNTRVLDDKTILGLLIGFDGQRVIVVTEGGLLYRWHIEETQIERPSSEFPLGYKFSRVQVEEEG